MFVSTRTGHIADESLAGAHVGELRERGQHLKPCRQLMVYLWRAVDAEGEVLDVLVQSNRNKQAALKLIFTWICERTEKLLAIGHRLGPTPAARRRAFSTG